MKKYTREEIKELLRFFKRNNILLINEEHIGEVNLSDCEVDEEWIIEKLTEE